MRRVFHAAKAVDEPLNPTSEAPPVCALLDQALATESTTDPHPASDDREVIDMAAATLLEVDQQKFEKAFKLLARRRTRDPTGLSALHYLGPVWRKRKSTAKSLLLARTLVN